MVGVAVGTVAEESHKLKKSGSIFALVFGAVILWQSVLAFLVRTSVFSTTNGIWKLSVAELWARGEGHIDYANVLYLAFATVVSGISGYFGANPSGPLVFANIFFMSMASGLVAVSIFRLTSGVTLAIGWAIAFGLSGHVLTNSLGSEDIAGAVLGISVVLYLLTHVENRQRLSVRFLIGLSLALAFVHLWEWRAALPLYFGIGLSWLLRVRGRSWSESVRELTVVSGTILVSLLAVLFAVVGIFRLSHNPVWFWSLGVIFPGKGLGTVWAGFTTEKVELQFVGLSENVIGGRNLVATGADNWTWLSLLAVVIVYALFGLGIVRGLKSTNHTFVTLVGSCTWLGGVLFALYTQPQDPQIQVTQSPQLFIWTAIGAQWFFSRALRSKGGVLGRLMIPTFVVVISLSHFQGLPPIWTKQNKSDNEFFVEARMLHYKTSSGRAVLYGSGWETQLAWVSLVNGGKNINFVGYHGPFDDNQINGFFPLNFISADPSGSPRDWICASITEFTAMGSVSAVSIESHPINFIGYRTIASDAKVDEYQKLWGQAYGNTSQLSFDPSFGETYCR